MGTVPLLLMPKQPKRVLDDTYIQLHSSCAKPRCKYPFMQYWCCKETVIQLLMHKLPQCSNLPSRKNTSKSCLYGSSSCGGENRVFWFWMQYPLWQVQRQLCCAMRILTAKLLARNILENKFFPEGTACFTLTSQEQREREKKRTETDSGLSCSLGIS